MALALQVPVFVVITKIDMCPKNILEATLKQLVKILKSSGCRKVPVFIHSKEDVFTAAKNFCSERLCPIFQVSNVNGLGLENLKLFMNVLQTNTLSKYDPQQPVEYRITDTFSVPGGKFFLSFFKFFFCKKKGKKTKHSTSGNRCFRYFNVRYCSCRRYVSVRTRCCW